MLKFYIPVICFLYFSHQSTSVRIILLLLFYVYKLGDISFFSALWRYNGQITGYKFEVYNVMI